MFAHFDFSSETGHYFTRQISEHSAAVPSIPMLRFLRARETAPDTVVAAAMGLAHQTSIRGLGGESSLTESILSTFNFGTIELLNLGKLIMISITNWGISHKTFARLRNAD